MNPSKTWAAKLFMLFCSNSRLADVFVQDATAIVETYFQADGCMPPKAIGQEEEAKAIVLYGLMQSLSYGRLGSDFNLQATAEARVGYVLQLKAASDNMVPLQDIRQTLSAETIEQLSAEQVAATSAEFDEFLSVEEPGRGWQQEAIAAIGGIGLLDSICVAATSAESDKFLSVEADGRLWLLMDWSYRLFIHAVNHSFDSPQAKTGNIIQVARTMPPQIH